MLELNEQQQEAAEFLYGTAIVLAVPGSGKTHTMTARIANLVTKHKISPEQILGLTFTRNAAASMRSRLKPLLSKVAEKVHLSTLHSFCHMVLRNEKVPFQILNGGEQIRLIRELISRHRAKEVSVGLALREIALAKNNVISPEEFTLLFEGDPLMSKVAQLYTSYEEHKEERYQFDLDDLLLKGIALLQQEESIRDQYQNTFLHLLVDEFQDTSPAQMELLKLLLNPKQPQSSFWVCGDDWQAIYGWMGSSVSNILQFEETFPQAKKCILNINYRSTPQILRACQRLIAHNERKMDKVLETNNPDGEEVFVLESEDEDDEAEQVAREILDMAQREGMPWKDIAVLYRCNFQSRYLEERLAEEKIPYFIHGGKHFYAQKEIQGLLDYLRFMQNPTGQEGSEILKRIVNIPCRYISRKLIEEMECFSIEHGISLYEALEHYPVPMPFIRKNIKSMLELLNPLIQDINSLRPLDGIQYLREALQYDQCITEDEIPSPDDEKVANVQQLELAAAKFDTIATFLEHIDTFGGDRVGDDPHGVRLMTIHKSKGLEFPVVFVVGLLEGLLPSKKGNIEEERRICFVGISRAMKRLYLSHSNAYLGQPAQKSPFLDEILQEPSLCSTNDEADAMSAPGL